MSIFIKKYNFLEQISTHSPAKCGKNKCGDTKFWFLYVTAVFKIKVVFLHQTSLKGSYLFCFFWHVLHRSKSVVAACSFWICWVWKAAIYMKKLLLKEFNIWTTFQESANWERKRRPEMHEFSVVGYFFQESDFLYLAEFRQLWT